MSNSNHETVVIILYLIITFSLSLAIQYFCPIITAGDSTGAFIICAFIQWIILAIVLAVILSPILDYLDKKEAKTNNTPKNNTQITCEYYNNGKCVAGGHTNQSCSFNNPKNYVECPVYRYNALGDVSALY